MPTCLPGLTGPEVAIGVHSIMAIYGYSGLVDLSTRVDRSRCINIISRHYGYSVLVHLLTCLPGLTCSEVKIGVLVFMGILYSFTCRPVNLSTRVDRSRR